MSVYSEAGWQRDLTSLNQGRHNHACGSYVNGGKKVIKLVVSYHTCWLDGFNFQFILVTGGNGILTVPWYLDSTEIFSENVWRTLAAKLPVPMNNLGIATINNRVILFGNSFVFCLSE